MPYGYVGKVLWINLTDKEIKEHPFDNEVLRNYIGGSGLAAKIIYENVPPETDPLSPENLLVFMTGPLTGTIIPGSGRHTVSAKSPLTGIWGEANVGGYWGTEIKKAGYDGVIFEGASEKPVYLLIENSNVQIMDAGDIWGLDALETGEKLQEKHGKVRVSAIGRAGEKQVKIANIISDDGRAAGRTGLGAVMGSKKLKAVAVKGTGTIQIAEPQKLRRLISRVLVTIRADPHVQILASYGTDGIMLPMHTYGDVPIKYFTMGEWEGLEKICGEAMVQTILVRQYACHACPIGCGRIVKVDEEPYKMEGHGPEYETAASLGSLLLIDNLKAIAKMNDLCNRYGIDTISTGSVIAYAIECYEKGLLKTDVKLEWGNPDLAIKLIKMIGEKQDLGELLSQGVKKMGEELGGEAEKLALHVKGLEIPMHDPRAFYGMALQYATSHRGACHLRGLMYQIEQGVRIPDLGIHKRYHRDTLMDKPEPLIAMQNWHDLLDSLVLCKFVAIPPATVAAMYQLATGIDLKLKDLLKAGERTYNLKRLYSIKCSPTGREDKLPHRFMEEPLAEGGAKGMIPRELREALKKYYELRGWDEKGIPTEEKLKELGII